ncbi:class I SAM-dependent methyltransferase [candidate division KSB1 bacterium]|nr:class I SAM-dependent methyltransferase [candidate division KSB1 bacterium]
MNTIKLKPGRERSMKRKHPWIFSGAIADKDINFPDGETVAIIDDNGKWLASGAYSSHSQIRVRIWSFDSGDEIDVFFLKRRIDRSLQRRSSITELRDSNAYRLVNAESDGLPGLVVDRYDNFIVCQFFSSGAEHWKREIVDILMGLDSVKGVYERSDADVRKLENLPLTAGLLAGQEPPEQIEIQEGAAKFLVNIRSGHKTGFYLDQRENRLLMNAFAPSKDVLNCYAFTGGFGIHALHADAKSVTQLDSSAEAIALAKANAMLNGFSENDGVSHITGDVTQQLRRFRDEGRQFDVIVLDPPKFAINAGQVDKAARAYKDINLWAMKLLSPGGTLFTFSCSGHVDRLLFQKIVAGAALDAGRDVIVTHHLSQAADHPVATNFPEGEYLKGLVCSVF